MQWGISRTQWHASRLFGITGALAVVAGGLVAAVTASVPSEYGAWAAAYLVLIVGVAQIALGFGQALLASGIPGRNTVIFEFVTFNVGNASVLAGTLLGYVWLVDAGGVLLVLALVMFLRGRRAPCDGWLSMAYRVLIAIVLMSIPVGLVLSRINQS
jgi:amino acid transporter